METPAPTRTQRASLPPEYFGHSHRPRKLASAAWSLLGWLLFAVMMIGALLLGRVFAGQPGGALIGGVAGLLLGTVLGLAMAKCLIHAKRLRAPSALETIARDQRPPVVYFRPFTADVDASKPVALTSWFTEEEQLAKMMNDLGPVVAIGAPEETLPLLGAARMYVKDPKWHEVALDLVGRARVIIMRIGASPGFWWEFETVVRSTRPEKLVLLIPRNQTLYEEFQTASRKLIPTVLPTLTGWDVKKWFRGNLKAVIFFDPAWVPSIVDVQTYRLPFLRRSPAMPLVPVLKAALRPVYENAGLRWTAPRVNLRMVVLLVAGALFVVAQIPALLINGPDWSYPSATPPAAVFEAAPRSAVTVATERFVNRIQEVPEFASQFEAISASAGSSPEEKARARQTAQALGAQLSQLGLKRLDDDSLLAMGAIQTKLLMQADVAGCAALARGNAGRGVMPILEKLDAADVERFFDLLYEAMMAEVRKSPPARHANERRVQETLEIILTNLPEQDRERLRNALIKGTGDDDEETCWMGRTLQAGVDKLDRADRVQWLLQ